MRSRFLRKVFQAFIFITLGIQLCLMLGQTGRMIWPDKPKQPTIGTTEPDRLSPIILTTAAQSERTRAVQFIVLHSFAIPVPDMIHRLAALNVSTHYLIDTDGRLFRLVPEDKVAWRAGRSFWRGQSRLNETAIGVELQNATLGQTPFTPAQIETLKHVLSDLIVRYDILPQNIVAHSDIAPERKVDVGAAFPWKALAQDGIGLYPEPVEQLPSVYPTVPEMLADIGYDITDPDKALLAFERRFMPTLIPMDPDIAHLEENLHGQSAVWPVQNPAVLNHLIAVWQVYRP